MKTRLIKNWITTLFGTVIFAGACYMFYTSKINWETFSAAVTLSMLLFRAKDSLLWAKSK